MPKKPYPKDALEEPPSKVRGVPTRQNCTSNIEFLNFGLPNFGKRTKIQVTGEQLTPQTFSISAQHVDWDQIWNLLTVDFPTDSL